MKSRADTGSAPTGFFDLPRALCIMNGHVATVFIVNAIWTFLQTILLGS